jgi:hypothetical protein
MDEGLHMSKTLVALGCSHTAGSELFEGIGDHPNNRINSYAGTLAKKLNYEYINLAVNGGSNDLIFRRTIEFINININNIDQYVFLIGWTSSARTELRYADDNNYIHDTLIEDYFYDSKYIPITVGTVPEVIKDPRMRKMIVKNSDILMETNQCADKWANYAFALQKIFEAYNLKYFMFNTIHGQIRTPSNQQTIKNLNTKRYYKPEDNKDTFFFYCRDVLGYRNITKWWHHKQPAHNAWAEILYERSKKWLS